VIHLTHPLVAARRKNRVLVFVAQLEFAGARHLIDARVPLPKRVDAFRTERQRHQARLGRGTC